MTESITFSVDGPRHFYVMMNQQVSHPELKSCEDMKALGSCLSAGAKCCGGQKTIEKECENIYNRMVTELRSDEEKLIKIKSSMNCDEICFMLEGNIIYQSNE